MTSSLHNRITLGMVSFAGALFLALILLEKFFIQQVAEYYVATRLEHDNETLLVALQAAPESQSYTLTENRIHPIYQRPFSGHYYKIALPSQTLRSRSLWDESLNINMDQPTYPALLNIYGPEDTPLLVFIERYDVAGQAIIIATAESMDQLNPLIKQAQLWSMVAACLLILLFILVQYRWIKKSLQPLQLLQSQLKELHQGQRKQLDIQPVFAELSPLITELNQLLLALDERITRSRHAMGNLAHALKTPMASLQQLCETDAQQDAPLINRIQGLLNVINHRVDSELKRARIAGSKGKREPLCVRDELIDLTHTLKKIYSEKGIQIQLNIPADAHILFDRQDFLELTGNLLDNGFKWAITELVVTIDTHKDLRISIEDDGPGCESSQLALLAERGKRLDESIPGHGLGLSIVADIVAQYHGELYFKKSHLGGLLVQVTIPLNT